MTEFNKIWAEYISCSAFFIFLNKTIDKCIIMMYNHICKVFLVYTKGGDILAKDLSVSMLLDFYAELLTKKQQEALDMYYNQDMSLAEIAENMEVSRQGVRAFIKQGEAHLLEFEEKLGMVNRFSKISRIVSDLQNSIDLSDNESLKNELSAKIDDIKKQL